MPTTSVVNTSEFHQRIPINSTAKHTWPAAHAWQFMTTLQFRETLTRMEMALTDNDLHSCGETQKSLAQLIPVLLPLESWTVACRSATFCK